MLRVLSYAHEGIRFGAGDFCNLRLSNRFGGLSVSLGPLRKGMLRSAVKLPKEHMYYTHKSSTPYNILSFLTVFLFVIAGCTEPEIDNDFLEDLGDQEAVYFEPIGQGSQGSFDVRTERVISDSTTWASYQDKLETVLPFRHIDFSQLMVAFAAVPSTHGGVTVQFEAAERIEGELVLNYLVGMPGRDCRVIDTPSVPFQVMVIRKFDLPVRFEYREERQPCTLG